MFILKIGFNLDSAAAIFNFLTRVLTNPRVNKSHRICGFRCKCLTVFPHKSLVSFQKKALFTCLHASFINRTCKKRCVLCENVLCTDIYWLQRTIPSLVDCKYVSTNLLFTRILVKIWDQYSFSLSLVCKWHSISEYIYIKKHECILSLRKKSQILLLLFMI